MNKKLVIVIGVAVLAATGSTYFFYRMISQRFEESGEFEPQNLSVVVAAHDLRRGLVISLNDVKQEAWSGKTLPAGVVTNVGAVVGKVVAAAAATGETLFSHHILTDEDAFLAARVRPGMRAVSVHLSEFAGVNQIVETGDKVDVLVATAGPSAGNDQVNVKTILQNIEVLTTGRGKNGGGIPVATLLVAAEHSELLNAADHAGYIRLALRNPLDEVVSPTPGTRLGDVIRSRATSSESKSGNTP